MDVEQSTEQVAISIQDDYTWTAYYGPGEGYLEERHATAGFASVESGCTSLVLRNQATEAEHVVDIPSGAEPVFFRRRTLTLDPDGQSQDTAAHCIGWLRDGQGVYLFILPDGSALLSSDLQAV